MISVVLADDQALIRTAVAELVSHEEGFRVAGQAGNGREAVELVRQTRPDIVLMDIRMPVMDGIQATAAICADPDLAGTRIVVLTTFEEDEYVVAALRAGASGFIGKGAEPDDIVRAVRTVHLGDSLLSSAATRALVERYVHRRAPRADAWDTGGLARLTEREREVFLLVAAGRTNGDIADELVISTHTAKTHVNRIMTKLYAHDRAQLVIITYEAGLLVPGERG